MIRVILNGAAGRMGAEVEKLIVADDALSLVARVDRLGEEAGCYPSLSAVGAAADVIIDFSHHAATADILAYAKEKNLPVLIATTGQTDEENAMIAEAAKEIPVFHSANMSLGVALLAELAKKTAAGMPGADIEIVETHHNRKLDAPSGTALLLANAIRTVREKAKLLVGRNGACKREKDEIGISSIRRGNIVGIHEVIVSTDNETITLKHEAHSRALFADGAIAAAKFLVGKGAGLYTMDDMIR